MQLKLLNIKYKKLNAKRNSQKTWGKKNIEIGNLGLGEVLFSISLVEVFYCLNYIYLLLRKNKTVFHIEQKVI